MRKPVSEGHGSGAGVDSPESVLRSSELGSNIILSWNVELNIQEILEQRGYIDKRGVGKRTALKKSGALKEELIGTNGAQITLGMSLRSEKLKDEKGLKHHEDFKHTKNRNLECHSGDSVDDAIVISDSETSVGGSPFDSFCPRDDFPNRIQRNSGRAYTAYLGKSKQMQRSNRTKDRPREMVRNHLRTLMFPNKTSRTIIPWAKLGIWLYFKKKRFINWPRSVSFSGGKMGKILANELRKLLVVDLVDWSQDEIKFETTRVPLILDPTGHVLVKVGDLQRIYPGHDIMSYEHVFFRDEENEDGNSKLNIAFSPVMPSASTAIRSPKPKHQTCSSKKRPSFPVTDSDGEMDSDSQSEGEGVSSYKSGVEYRSEEMVTRPKINAKRRCKRVSSY